MVSHPPPKTHDYLWNPGMYANNCYCCVYRCDFLWLLFSEGAHPMKSQTGRSNTHTLQLVSTTCIHFLEKRDLPLLHKYMYKLEHCQLRFIVHVDGRVITNCTWWYSNETQEELLGSCSWYHWNKLKSVSENISQKPGFTYDSYDQKKIDSLLHSTNWTASKWTAGISETTAGSSLSPFLL